MEFLFAVVAVSLVVMLGTGAYQVLLYLSNGRWVEFSAVDFCAKYLGVEWCREPRDWASLHALLELFSPGGLLFLLSVVVLGTALLFDGQRQG